MAELLQLKYRTARVEIRRNSDGVVRLYADNYWDGNDYSWAEGNYSCDCNRSLFFQDAVGVGPEEATDYECGDGAFSVRITDGGKVVYQDGEGWS